MTQIISPETYFNLVENRNEQLAKISSQEAEIASLTAEIKDDEQFIANYETIIAGFEATIESLENQLDSLVASIEANNTAQEENDEKIDAAEAELGALQETLDEVKETGTPAQIAAAQAAVDAKQEELDQLNATGDSLKAQEENLKIQEETAKEAKDNVEKDKEEAEIRKADLDEGGLEKKKNDLQEVQDKNAASQAEYDEWIATNGPLIASFEKQQGFRDEVIVLTNNRNNYNRLRSSNLNDLIHQENSAVKQVILTDLDEDNLTDPEKDLRTNAYEKGTDSEINPDYLSRDQAAELARAVRFSTLEVASKIKAAAMRGDFSISVPRLADTTIYALQQSGYNVYLTSQSEDALFKVDWSNIEGGEA